MRGAWHRQFQHWSQSAVSLYSILGNTRNKVATINYKVGIENGYFCPKNKRLRKITGGTILLNFFLFLRTLIEQKGVE
ncbi:hypothetical protein NBG4_110035 [Candidatus Sulfobium mesophilum]|uniref:Uncharacterized protein n=1 Tax=Candidatus Sulfobium mesophilum TaxID=2016548 RepID=A0A2U3QE79_9BACT|nr:hypothetical protein NBG4_110035 [Candidatus Sulfobium mesophilum]